MKAVAILMIGCKTTGRLDGIALPRRQFCQHASLHRTPRTKFVGGPSLDIGNRQLFGDVSTLTSNASPFALSGLCLERRSLVKSYI
jgi:hypothetical protein